MEMSVTMKRNVVLFVLLLAVPTIAAAQTQTRERRSIDPEPLGSQSTAVRDRVVGPSRAANHAEKPKADLQSKDQGAPASNTEVKPPSADQTNQNNAQPKWGNTAVVVLAAPNQRIAPVRDSTPGKSKSGDQKNQGVKKLVQQTAMATPAGPVLPATGESNANSRKFLTRAGAPTVIYQVGIGDVLDIRLANLPTRESTLFTVMKNGVLEYPLLNGPLAIAGLTTDEIARLLSNEIKVIKTARVSVSVRDYASHAVVISGLVDSPGRKTLRREAMPLYAVLAEGLPRPEAAVATIVREGKEQTISLKNEQAMTTLVLPGDVIKVSVDNRPATWFVYVGGEVSSPGEREFREGMTLTQALLSAGGVSRAGTTSVKVARRNANGFLTSKEYNLRSIVEGKVQDPLLEAGDRVEVTRGL
jgi:protein involved in polysaccharide export with SLBB domain